MDKNETACAYLENMAWKFGVDAVAYANQDKKTFTMCKRNAWPTDPRITVSLDMPKRDFQIALMKLTPLKRI